MNQRNQKSSLLSELTRRRVLRSAAAYIVVAWVVVQVGSIIFPEFDAPAWSMRALIIVLVVGFPPAVLLSWTVDFSKQGFSRTPDSGYLRSHGQRPRLLTLLFATAMSAGVLWWVWDDYILQSGQRPERSAIENQPVIAVNSPRQRLGSAKNAWLGDGVANLIRGELEESRHAIVISQSRWRALTNDVTNFDRLVGIARQLGADYLIDGDYIETSNSIVLTTIVKDLATGVEIHSSRTSEPDSAGLIASVPEHSTHIKQALRIPHTERVGFLQADFATKNIAAYEAYIAGLGYWDDGNYEAAATAFDAALETAPNYHIARLRLAELYEQTGRSAFAWTTLDKIPSDADLSERLSLYISGAKAYFIAKQNPKKAIEVYSRLVELYPYEFEARVRLSNSYWINFQKSAAIEEARRVTEIHGHDSNAWLDLGNKLLDFGDLDEAKLALEKYAAMQPMDAYAHSLLGDLAQLQGDLDASVENYRLAMDLKPGLVASTIGLARTRYLQGDTAAARLLWQSVISDEGQAAPYRIDAAFDLAGMLRGLGMYEDSIKPLADMMPLIERGGLYTAMAFSQQASAQFENGNHKRAQALFEESIRVAPSLVTRYLFARGLAELQRGQFEVVGKTIDDIIAGATEIGNNRENAAGAANYLNGLSALQQDDLTAASTYLTAAVEGTGYRYSIYELGLARLYQTTANLDRAKALAKTAMGHRGEGDLRIDLELDRARALLLLAEILIEQGTLDEGRERAQEFLDRWKDANADLPEIIRARKLITASADIEGQ